MLYYNSDNNVVKAVHSFLYQSCCTPKLGLCYDVIRYIYINTI